MGPVFPDHHNGVYVDDDENIYLLNDDHYGEDYIQSNVMMMMLITVIAQ